ncbi:hypothetical protein, partial [Raoultella ornithinolytica]
LEPWKASGCIRFAKSNRINFNQSSRYKEGSLTAVAAGEQVVCSGQLKLATVLEFFQYRFSDSFGGNPPL